MRHYHYLWVLFCCNFVCNNKWHDNTQKVPTNREQEFVGWISCSRPWQIWQLAHYLGRLLRENRMRIRHLWRICSTQCYHLSPCYLFCCISVSTTQQIFQQRNNILESLSGFIGREGSREWNVDGRNKFWVAVWEWDSCDNIIFLVVQKCCVFPVTISPLLRVSCI